MAGTANDTTQKAVCPSSVQTCTGVQCPIPFSQMIASEFGTGSSLEAGPIGNSTASYGDDQTPTTTADGQNASA